MAKRKLYELTEEHREQLGPWAQRWIANAMSTAPMTEADREVCVKAVHGMYEAAKLPPPRVVFVPSPFVGAFSAGFAAGIWYLRLSNGGAATAAATWDATLGATDDATFDATRVATWDATQAATFDATFDATRAAMRDATQPATRGATEAATWDATHAATEATTHAATLGATFDATRDATFDATWVATWIATQAATRDATQAATDDTTQAATDDATRDATWVATRDATHAATEAATDAATWNAESWCAVDIAGIRRVSFMLGGDKGNFLLRCAEHSNRLRQGGNQWSGNDAYLSFFQEVAGLDLPEYKAYRHWRTLSEHSGPRYVHKEFCIISDRPERLLVDAQNRPHCEDGPFCRWRDGSELYSIHGVRVPRWIVTNPDRITIEAIEAEKNTEIQRVMIERFGWERYTTQIGGEIVDYDERWGTLRRKRINNGEAMLWLEVTNRTAEPDGTFRHYVLTLDSELRPIPDVEAGETEFGAPQKLTALNAVASTFGLCGEEYSQRMGPMEICES